MDFDTFDMFEPLSLEELILEELEEGDLCQECCVRKATHRNDGTMWCELCLLRVLVKANPNRFRRTEVHFTEAGIVTLCYQYDQLFTAHTYIDMRR